MLMSQSARWGKDQTPMKTWASGHEWRVLNSLGQRLAQHGTGIPSLSAIRDGTNIALIALGGIMQEGRSSAVWVAIASLLVTACSARVHVADAGAEDAGTCKPDSLAAHCIQADCPDKIDSLRANLCAGGDLTATVQVNSFDADATLAGIDVVDGVARGCTSRPGTDVKFSKEYGRACELVGSASKLCEPGCPAIGCRSGASFKLDSPFTFAAARMNAISVCRNAECFTGTLDPLAAEPGVESGSGWTAPSGGERQAMMSGMVTVFLMGEASGDLYWAVDWTPWADADLVNGDRYRVTAQQGEGTTVLMDKVIEYGTNMIGSDTCRQVCTYVALDLRGEEGMDAGAWDSGG
jgi:hypothetical protein